MTAADRYGLDYAALRAAIPLEQVLRLLDFRPAVIRGRRWRGACPLHEPRETDSTCFSADLDRHLFRCFRCQAGGNQLDLWTAHTGLPLYEAALNLCRRQHLTPPKRSPPE